MIYLIYEHEALKRVDEDEYERWLQTDSDHYLLPIFKTERNGATYIIDSDYQGVFDDGDECCPFVLYYIEELAGDEDDKEEVQYFNTFDELKTRQQQLITTLEKKFSEQHT